jgi:hypothetical protein
MRYAVLSQWSWFIIIIIIIIIWFILLCSVDTNILNIQVFWTQYQSTGKLLRIFERDFLPRSSCSTYSSSWTAGTLKTKAVSSSETSVTIILYNVILVDLNSILVSFFDYPEDGDSQFRQNVCPSTRCHTEDTWICIITAVRKEGLANVLLQLGHLKVYVWYSVRSDFLWRNYTVQ